MMYTKHERTIESYRNVWELTYTKWKNLATGTIVSEPCQFCLWTSDIDYQDRWNGEYVPSGVHRCVRVCPVVHCGGIPCDDKKSLYEAWRVASVNCDNNEAHDAAKAIVSFLETMKDYDPAKQ